MSDPLHILLLAAAFAALILGLASPVELAVLAGGGGESWQWKISVCWLFGLVRRDLNGGRGSKPRAATEPAKKSGRTSPMPGLLRDGVVRERLLAFLGATLGAVTMGRSRLHLRLGLEDPADTGSVLGQIYSILPLIRAWAPRMVVTLQPEFEEQILEAEADCRVQVVPARILLRWSRLLFDTRTWKAAIRILRRI